MKFRLLLCLLAFLSIGVRAEEITGAFGYKLGEKVSDELVKKGQKRYGRIRIFVTPSNSLTHKYFDSYGVFVTPKSHLILDVVAWGNKTASANCHHSQEILVNTLEKKYNSSFKKEFMESLNLFIYRLKKEAKDISIHCGKDDNGKPYLTLSYTDTKLEKQGEQEMLELEIEKTNTKGL